ncbi:hypothetical protein [Blastomonas sp.]|uniref:hypothetical protein n=1 Tax=Blastomonas sp. TaxID=1909299 RepID=UPI00391A5E18
MSISDGLRGIMTLMAGLVVMLSGCGSALPDYRYRLTVEVETPEGLKTGSSVVEVSTAIAGKNSIPSPGYVSRRARGDAVTVDLGKRGVLFGLLRSDENSDWAAGVMFGFAPDVPIPRDADGKYDTAAHFRARYMAMLENRKLIVLPERFKSSKGLARPMLVRFRDITDPTTVERVDPDDLAISFGEGVRLRRVTIQLTDDPVITGIEKHLRWLDSYRSNKFDGSKSSITDRRKKNLASQLSAGSFSTEFAR